MLPPDLWAFGQSSIFSGTLQWRAGHTAVVVRRPGDADWSRAGLAAGWCQLVDSDRVGLGGCGWPCLGGAMACAAAGPVSMGSRKIGLYLIVYRRGLLNVFLVIY